MIVDGAQSYPLGDPTDTTENGYIGGIFSLNVKGGKPVGTLIPSGSGTSSNELRVEVLYGPGGTGRVYWESGADSGNQDEIAAAVSAAGGRCVPLMTSLMIDMDNSGIALAPPLPGVPFDLDANGVKERVSWPTKSSTMFLD